MRIKDSRRRQGSLPLRSNPTPGSTAGLAARRTLRPTLRSRTGSRFRGKPTLSEALRPEAREKAPSPHPPFVLTEKRRNGKGH